MSVQERGARNAGPRSATVIMARIPRPGATKTRMMPDLTGQQCAEVHARFIRDGLRACLGAGGATYLAYTPAEDKSLLDKTLLPLADQEIRVFPQEGMDLGERMFYAMNYAFEEGCARCVLVGSDVPEVSSAIIDDAFAMLDTCDAVIGPAADGGFYLFATKDPAIARAAFSLREYGHGRVFEETMRALESAGVNVGATPVLEDVDTFADAKALVGRHGGTRCRLESVEYLRPLVDIGQKDVSIVVPVYNEASTIKALQSHLRPLLGSAEVILVDGGSTDGTQHLVEDGFKLVSSQKGRARQMNKGAEAASGDVLLFLHADSLLPSGAIEMVRDVLQTNDWGCFGIQFDRKTPWVTLCAFLSNRRAMRGIAFGDQGIFIKRALFDAVGRFPEIELMEDYQLSLTLRERGARPGMTDRRILTSARRFPRNPIGFYRVLFQMAMLRKDYRNGVDPSELAKRYRDVR